MTTPTEPQHDPPRRSFLASLTAGLAALVAIATPIATGVVVLLDPLRRPRSSGQWVRVTSLNNLPADGQPYRFPVVDEQPRDKWNLYEPQPVGSVYLTRTSASDPPTALSAVCPHLGCNVDFKPTSDTFHCPCHNANFEVDGTQSEGSTVSPRNLDSLAVEIRNGDQVWVDYRRFKSGVAAQVEA